MPPAHHDGDEVTREDEREALVEELQAPTTHHGRDPDVGDRVGDYTLLDLLGQGGAALVFRARRGRDGAVVALKVLTVEKMGRPRIVQRFFDEAKTASSVQHPSLVDFVEMVELSSPRRLAYAMEYVAGQPLRARLSSGQPIPLVECIHIAKQMCAGILALHHAGIIHRDLKPENVMLVARDGPLPAVKILDFGVAKFLSAPADHGPLQKSETPGTFVGTPRYMAPEQAAGGAVDGRSDLFAVGVMLFEMITGQRPHEGDTLKAVVMAKLKGAPRLLMNPDREILPQELADVVDACLKLQPDMRPPDARTVIRILDEAQAVLAAVGSVRMDPTAGVVRTDPRGQMPSSGHNPAPPLPARDKNNREVVSLRPEPSPASQSGPPRPAPPMLTPPAAPALGPLPAPRKGLRDRFFSFGLAMFGLAVVIAGGAALLGLRGPSVYVVPLPSPAAPIPSAHPGTSIGSVRASSTASAAAPRDPPLPKPVRAPIPAG